MKKTITLLLSAFLVSCFSLSAMQKDMKDIDKLRQTEKSRKLDYSELTHEERLTKIEEQQLTDVRYYDYLSSYRAKIYFLLDFLYWTADNHGWDNYAVDTVVGNTTNIDIQPREFDYGPGVRCGLGAKTPLDWHVYLGWTYFVNTTKDRAIGNLQMSNTLVRNFENFEGSLKISYSMFDLEFDRPFHGGKTFNFRPHFGLRAGWVKQVGTNVARDDLSTPGTYTTPSIAYYKDSMWVVGPRLGCDAELFFARNWGFSIYGNFAAALLYGNVKSRLSLHWTELISTTIGNTYNLTMKDDEIKATMQTAIGLSWGDFITEDEDVALRIRLGWESNYWWNMYYPTNFVPTGGTTVAWTLQKENEPLIFQGLVLGARVDF